ncbi:transcriptional repressor [candidate division FCPU426 bacterium]|nr:transcriptional repressor [candidate division FCPU426 bacterium]
MAIYRESHQRRAVMANLTHRRDHPTAATIYDDLRKEIPALSLGTVYRNLDILETQNRIRSIKLDQREARYDADMNIHAHYLCRVCGKIMDLPLKPDCCQIVRELEAAGHRIEKVSIDIIGTCALCR